MTDNNTTMADAASEARGGESTGSTGFSPTNFSNEKSAFDFGGQQGQEQGQANTPATLKTKAFTKLQSEADNRKGMVSDQLKQVSGALGAIGASQGGGEVLQWLSNGVGQTTKFIDRIAEQVETRNSAELVADVRDFARSNPALFLGAAALAGFAAVRLFSAASDSR